MPRYYFDVQQNSQIERDFVGTVVPSRQDVRHYALRVMSEALLDAPPVSQFDIKIGVRDQAGKRVYQGHLVYQDGSDGDDISSVG